MILNGKVNMKLGTTAGAFDDWHEGNDPAGVTPKIQNYQKIKPKGSWETSFKLFKRIPEAQTLARACGKSHLANLEPEDLFALTGSLQQWHVFLWPVQIGYRYKIMTLMNDIIH